ncbi:MAG: Gfo/Idh/MocA family oxidoreductase [Chromatiales bacterium]|nr:Gfo/Idh/MocA family oxidoreductase [Chromatiales bacterium]
MTHQVSPNPKVGIVSFAHYHANFWAEALNSHEHASLAGIWDADVGRGKEAADRFNTPFYASLEALLAASNGVAICSENSNHAEHIAAAVKADRHVLCEKPIATSVTSALHVRDVVRAGTVVYMQSFPKRFDPISHELKRIVDSGQLGRLHTARVRHGHYHGLDPEFRKQWYTDPVLGGGGALLDEGVHAADLLCWLFGVPQNVVAMVSSATLGLKVDDTAFAVFGYGSGMLAEIVSSSVFQAAGASIEIYGDKGTAIVSGVDLASRDITDSGYLKVFDAQQSERTWQVSELVPRFKLGEFHLQNMLGFVACLREGKPPPITIEDGIRALALIEAAYTAARSGVRQDIDIEQRLT